MNCMTKTMDSIIITPSCQQDLELLASIARKMGFRAEISRKEKVLPKHDATDEITLMSESAALAEEWLSTEDEVYNDL